MTETSAAKHGTQPTSRGRPGMPHSVEFAGMGGVLVLIFIAAAAPSPLFLVYQRQWGFPTALITVAFAVYALALLAALLTVGSLSDHVGRRPVLVVAMAGMVAAMLLFLIAPNISTIVVARIVQGFATGAATGAVSAALTDLAPTKNRSLGATITGLAPLGGLALGALFSGTLAQFGRTPLPTVFGSLTLLFVVAGAFVALSSESVTRRPGALRSLTPRVVVPKAARTAFSTAAPLTAASWMVGGFYLGLVSLVMRHVLAIDSDFVDGIAIATVMGVGCATVFALRATPTRAAGITASLALAVGLTITGGGILSSSFTVFIVGTVVAGIGFGGAFSATLRSVAPKALPHQRGELFAAIYVVSYLSFGLPSIIASTAVGAVGIAVVAASYAALIVIASCVALTAQIRSRSTQEGAA